MSWVRVDDKFPRHPKVIGLSAAAIALWLSACCWASEYETDGFLPAAAVDRLPWYEPEAVGELQGAGLWEEVADGWLIHDFLKFNPSKQQRENKRTTWRTRQAEHRGKTKEPVQSPVTLGQQGDSTRESRVSQGNGEGELDLFNTKGSAEGGHRGESPAAKVLALLNAARKRVIPDAHALRPTPTNLKGIADRLREGHTPEECAHVIAVCESESRTNPESAKWFNAVTPFLPKNFGRKLGMQPQAPKEAPAIARQRQADAAAEERRRDIQRAKAARAEVPEETRRLLAEDEV